MASTNEGILFRNCPFSLLALKTASVHIFIDIAPFLETADFSHGICFWKRLPLVDFFHRFLDLKSCTLNQPFTVLVMMLAEHCSPMLYTLGTIHWKNSLIPYSCPWISFSIEILLTLKVGIFPYIGHPPNVSRTQVPVLNLIPNQFEKLHGIPT